MRLHAVAAALLLLLSPPAWAEEPSEASFADELRRGLEMSVVGAAGGAEVPSLEGQSVEARIAEALRTFYLDRDLAPVWVTETGPGPRVEALTEILAAAKEDGLDPADYDLEAIRDLLSAPEATALAPLEIALSRSLLRFLFDLGGVRGRQVATAAGLETWPGAGREGAGREGAEREGVDAAALIAAAAAEGDLTEVVAAARPQGARYAGLREALARYRQIVAEGGWNAIPAGGPLRLGSISPRVPALRERLTLTGDLKPSKRGASALFDQALAAAVRRAQQRHGLLSDGVVGPGTLAALNVPATRRVAQLALNLERLRWMPEDLGEDFVQVNLAGASLRLVEARKPRLELRIAVGRPFRGTPFFSQDLTSIVFSPDWTVPPGVVGAELLPILRDDPGYLSRNGFTVFSDWSEEATVLDPGAIDWTTVDGAALAYKLRQAPGPENPLGRISFVFPNDFGLCLHDTPAKEPFEAGDRGFGLGCIRVETPELLAEALLAGTAGWSQDRIAEVLAEGTPTAVGLPDPVPIHITYMTAWAEGKAAQFRDDVFGRDAMLAKALRRRGG